VGIKGGRQKKGQAAVKKRGSGSKKVFYQSPITNHQNRK
jgi:hypothetical protein